jgi:hypothetical protein
VVPFEVWNELIDKHDAPEPGALLALRRVFLLPTQVFSPETTTLRPRAIRLEASLHARTDRGDSLVQQEMPFAALEEYFLNFRAFLFPGPELTPY